MMATSGANTANSVMARMKRFHASESSRRQPACGLWVQDGHGAVKRGCGWMHSGVDAQCSRAEGWVHARCGRAGGMGWQAEEGGRRCSQVHGNRRRRQQPHARPAAASLRTARPSAHLDCQQLTFCQRGGSSRRRKPGSRARLQACAALAASAAMSPPSMLSR